MQPIYRYTIKLAYQGWQHSSNMNEDRWYFSKDQLLNTPSKRYGIDADKELLYRQIAANLIQEMGQRLPTSHLCINTAIVYMHRFYMFHPFTLFHRNTMAAACLFLAAKNENQPRKLIHVLNVLNVCLKKQQEDSLHHINIKYRVNVKEIQNLVKNEEILLKTLGFETAIDHPHTHIVRCCHLVRASKNLSQTAYFMASNSLHFTTMCVQYKPTIVACFCIHLACKLTNWKLEDSIEGKPWFWYVDQSVTSEQLEKLTTEFLTVLDKCPSHLKKRLMATNTIDTNEALVNYCSSQQLQSPVSQLPSNYIHQSHSQTLNTRPTLFKPALVDFKPPVGTNGVIADHKSVVPVLPILPPKKPSTPIVPNIPLIPVKSKVDIPTTLNNNIKNEPFSQRPKFIPKLSEPVIQEVNVKQEMVVKLEPIQNPFPIGLDNDSEVISTNGFIKVTQQNDLNILSLRESPPKVYKPSILSSVLEDGLQDFKSFDIQSKLESPPKVNPSIFIPVLEDELQDIKSESELNTKPLSPKTPVEVIPKFNSELLLNPLSPTGTVEMDGTSYNSDTAKNKKKEKKHKKHKYGKNRHHKHKDKYNKPESMRITIPKEKILPLLPHLAPHSPPSSIKLKIAKEQIGGCSAGSRSGSISNIETDKDNRGIKSDCCLDETIPKKKHRN